MAERYNNNRGQRPQRKKRTGAKSGKDKHGNHYVSGWNASKQRGLISVYCTPYSKTKECTKSGRLSYNYMVKVQPKFGQDYIIGGFYFPDKNIVVIPKFGWVVNPDARNGGYCGTYNKN